MTILSTQPLIAGPLGFQELLIILLIIILIFGASKLPQLGKGLGEGFRNFKKGLKADDDKALEDSGTTPPANDEAT